MSDTLTAEAAIELLRDNPSQYQTREALRELARQVDIDSPGKVTVLYSGGVADRVSAWNVVKAMEANGEDVRLIDRTEINRFLNSEEFASATADAHGIRAVDIRTRTPAAKAANDWLYHPTDGPWADASVRFADATRGEVKVIASGAAPDRVFAQTELPRILANPAVTTVEGIPREVLAARQASHGSQAAFEMIVANSHDNVGTIRTAVNAQGVPLRGEQGQLQLDNREYFRGTSIEGRSPTFHEVTRPMSDLMGEPNAYARAGREHLDDIARAGASPTRASMGMGRVPGVAAGGIGVALTAADAAESGQRATSLYDMGNATGAQSELIHFTARNVGAWGGAALGAGVGAAVSSPSGPGAIIGGIVGGAVGLVGGQQLADVLDHRKIYLQKDEQGETWSFDPEAPARGWRRVETVDTLAPSGRPVEQRQQAVATGELDAQLDRKAATVSLELMLARPPVPRDPYTLPAAPGDASSIPASPWRRDPDSGQWKRHVYEWQDDGSDLGRQVLRETAVADPARAAQLEAQSQHILRDNVHLAPAAMAARYELAFHDNG